MKRNFGFVSITAISMVASSFLAFGKDVITPKDDATRQDMINRAIVWKPIATSEVDIIRGPEPAIRFGATISCAFLEPDPQDPPGGKTPKFTCRDKNGKKYKIKYGIDNGEVYAEVAASRLLWALGFPTDNYYPVRVECQGCPKDPWTYIEDALSGQLGRIGGDDRWKQELWEKGDRLFIPAVVELKFDGAVIEQHDKQGWGFGEFVNFEDLSRQEQIYREGLLIMMGLLQHADNKDQQQRLQCSKDQMVKLADGALDCNRPTALVHDLGWTFGHGWKANDPINISRMNLDEWVSTPVFANSACKINPHSIPDMFLVPKSQRRSWHPVQVSEAGRAFIASRLNALSRKQIEDIFRVSRVKMREPMQVGGIPDTVVFQWADALQAKIGEINNAKCPDMPKRLDD